MENKTYRLLSLTVVLAVLLGLENACGPVEEPTAISASPTGPPPTVEKGNQVAVEHFRRGVEYQEQGQLGEAIQEFTHAIEVESEFIYAYLFRGMTYIALGEPDRSIADLDRALPDLDRAIEHDPRLAEAYFIRGLAHFFKFDYDKAITDFDRAIELNSNYVEAYAVRGNAYDSNGELDRAISSYGEALALDLEKDQQALLLSDRGQAYARHGDKDLATADLGKALELGLPPVVAQEAEAILDNLAPVEDTTTSAAEVPSASRRIAFESGRDGNWEIYVMDADGSGQTRLTDNPALDGGPTWSPDGKRIAFLSDRDGDSEI
jgi:tetratricopeptide (TPR) repeat protein